MTHPDPPPNIPGPANKSAPAPDDPVSHADFAGWKRFSNREQQSLRLRVVRLESVIAALADFLEREVKRRRGEIE